MVDGLKISLRKILYSAFKRKLHSEIKVAQFSGYVSENSAYHHGEASLNGAIVNMAQNFVGSNNINVLVPNGQFGTRLKGGEDSASERYIFTYLNPLTRSIFPEADDIVLEYINDDGQLVEPTYYVPIIPFALVNGISGIGTGFSCNIPSYNPQQIIQYLRYMLQQNNAAQMDQFDFIPYFEGFQGTVTSIESQKYLIKGVYETVNDNTILIRELPIGTWTMNYISFLEELIDGSDKNKKNSGSIVKDFTNMSTESLVHITIVLEKGKKQELESVVDTFGVNGLEKALKLTTTVGTTNMNMFNSLKQLHKYKTVKEVIHAFYDVRMDTYDKRKKAQIQVMELKVKELSNRAKFIMEIVANTVDLRKFENDDEMNLFLKNRQYDTIQDKYDYLTHMPMHTMNKARVQKIIQERDAIINELEILKNTTISTMWLRELDVLENEYCKYKEARKNSMSQPSKKTTNKTSNSKTSSSNKKQKL